MDELLALALFCYLLWGYIMQTWAVHDTPLLPDGYARGFTLGMILQAVPVLAIILYLGFG